MSLILISTISAIHPNMYFGMHVYQADTYLMRRGFFLNLIMAFNNRRAISF